MNKYAPCTILLLALGLFGCAHQSDSREEQAIRIHRLTAELLALSPAAEPHATENFAKVAVTTAANLRGQYQVRMAPWIHNMEVNSGIKPRGLCFHYAKDMAAALQPLAAPDWELHLVQAKPKEVLEHNAIVITARGRPWQSGIVLDGWRYSGVLYFGPVMNDRYPWQPKYSKHHNSAITTSDHRGS